MSMEDLIQAMLGGAGASQGSASSGEDPLQGMLEQIMGGGAAQQGGGLMDIIGAIMGGGMPAYEGAPSQGITGSGGGLMDIISAILGGGGSSGIVEGVSGKTGLSGTIIQMILAFVMSKLLGGASGAGLGGLFPSGEAAYPGSAAEAGESEQGIDLDGLLEQMGQDRGMADELAQRTGLDSDTAMQGLQEVIVALGAQRRGGSSATAPKKESGLDGLLENW